MSPMTKPISVEAYLAGQPVATRTVLEALRRTIRAAAPGTEESIAYGMPAFRLNGHFLVSYAAYSRHFSLFPASQAVQDACGEELRPYISGRGTIKFQGKDPLPDALVGKIVKVRIAEVGARG
jgi:uncharacterized protein YdhG (YjbR/CyaY superfamily)